MTADDAEDRGQSQAPAGELGGEEGLEDALLRRLVHAGAGVGDLQGEIEPRSQVPLSVRPLQVFTRALRDAGGDGDDAAPLADGLRGIDDQVHNHLA